MKTIKIIVDKLPSIISNRIYSIYDYFFYKKNRKEIKHYGELNHDKTFYVIRPRDNTVEGLMSLLLNVVRQLKYIENKDYSVVFDFKNYKTQYLDENNKKNIWDDYFYNNSCSLDEVYKSRNVILCGLYPTRTNFLSVDTRMREDDIRESRELIDKYICINKTVSDILINELSKIDIGKTLGLYVRGTDYTKLKPTGHKIQPTINEILVKSDEFMNKYNLENIFLVTEDGKVYDSIKSHYGNRVITISNDSFINEYDENAFLSNSEGLTELGDCAYQRGLNYLIKILVLSKLKYLVAGNTCGSWGAMAFSEGFKDYYIFDLGNY